MKIQYEQVIHCNFYYNILTEKLQDGRSKNVLHVRKAFFDENEWSVI